MNRTTTAHMSTHLVTPRTFDHFVEMAEDLMFSAVAAEVDPYEVVFPVIKDAGLLDATNLKGNVMRAGRITTTPSHDISF